MCRRGAGCDVFGAPVAMGGQTVGQPFGFTGREHELDSGLTYHRDRYMQAAFGRWTQPDRLASARVLALFVLWARTTGQRLDVMLRRRRRLAVVLGLVFAVVLATAVVLSEPAGPRPEGLALVWAVLWRGVAYGAADGLLLSAFPILTVFAAAEGSKHRRRRSRTVVVGAALLASLAMTTVYHLGYRDFRSQLLVRPVVADLLWSVPTLVTLNPIGAPIAHAGMHVTAVLHSYDTQVFLPPHR